MLIYLLFIGFKVVKYKVINYFKIGKLKIVLVLVKYRFWNLNFCYGSDIV